MATWGIEEFLPAALQAQEEGKGAVIAAVVASTVPDEIRVASRLIVREDGTFGGRIHESLDALLQEDAIASLDEGRSRMRSYRLEPSPERTGLQQGQVDVFFEVLGRPPRLLIAGAGHIAAPLCRIASVLGFDVAVLDDRPEYASEERFPDATSVTVGPYRETVAEMEVDRNTYVVLVTRGHVHDQACLEEVLGREVAYVGMIGSKRRVRTVLSHLAAEGFDLERLRNVHAPIGLDIGAQTPEEIALAIMAEIVNVRRHGHGASLALGDRFRV